jgi:outer membrane murein-binding lipoprotein Lpp
VILASLGLPEIIVLVALVLVALLFAGGVVASGRRRDKLAGSLRERIEAADAALADARAQDKGWERATIEAAARAAAGGDVSALHLVQVVDKPGTDEDLAIFRVRAAGAASRLTLGRRDGAWYAVVVEDER